MPRTWDFIGRMMEMTGGEEEVGKGWKVWGGSRGFEGLR